MSKTKFKKALMLSPCIKKTCTAMRLLTIIMVFAILQVSATVYAQRFSMSGNNLTLKAVLTEIKSKTKYDYICTNELFRRSKRIDINVKDVEVEAVLKQVFQDQPLTYIIDSKTIVVKEKPKSSGISDIIEKIATKLQSIEVTGAIVDEKGMPLPGAIVKVADKGSFRVNNEGKFSLTCPDEDTRFTISHIGYITKELRAKNILKNKTIRLQEDISSLNTVSVQDKRIIGTKIDLKNKGYMNLAAVLEGGVPGLALRRETQTVAGESTIEINGRSYSLEEYYNEKKNTLKELSAYTSFDDFERAVISGEFSPSETNVTPRGKGAPAPRITSTGRISSKTRTLDLGMVPELRGASNFTGNTSGMLIVIDGFPQDGFPANFPMNNVSSIEVIRDPEECLKWGARAAGGVILITTNLAKEGQLQINYDANFYTAKPQDISAEKLRLASSADVLGLYKEIYDKKLATYLISRPPSAGETIALPNGLSPAEVLLYKLNANALTSDVFNQKWDSLGVLNNRRQLANLFQQTSFNQNHSLNLTGGSKGFKFSVGGLYSTSRPNAVGSKSEEYGLNLKNEFSLLKNKLTIALTANLSRSKDISRSAGAINILDPYQLILGPNDEYIYDYGVITSEQNDEMRKIGYFESGTNAMQDLMETSSTSKSTQINSIMNTNWQLLPALKWATSVQFSRTTGNTLDIIGANSSEARTLVNSYGAPFYDTNDGVPIIDFYVPPGGILNRSKGLGTQYNLRSGFAFDPRLGPNHSLQLSLDAGISSLRRQNLPYATTYGYTENTLNGLPIMMSVDGFVTNYLGSSVDISQLLVVPNNSVLNTRNISVNSSLAYKYLNRYSLNASYNDMMSPLYGQDPSYSTTSNRSVSARWDIKKEPFFKLSWFNELNFTVAANEIKFGKLPQAVINAGRFQQPIWGNSALAVNNFTFSQQSGQKNRSFSGTLNAAFLENNLLARFNYVVNSVGGPGQWNVRLFYDVAKSLRFNSSSVSSLQADVTLQNVNPFQIQATLMQANSLSSGNFSVYGNNNNGLLPPSFINKEAHLMLGLNEDRYTLDLRYYHKKTQGLSNGGVPTDPATGLNARVNYSEMLNTGVEAAWRAAIYRTKTFNWTVIINGAYNLNKAISVPEVNFSYSRAYLSRPRNGYPTDNLWNFRWAGLDNLGNPQIYDNDMQKITNPESGALIYVGRTTPPWSGGLSSQWSYKGFFASARFIFNLGHVMRRYAPVLSSDKDNSIEIARRWRKTGDELTTDVAAIAKADPARTLIIQGSDNLVMPGDNIRLRDIQLGYDFSARLLKGTPVKTLSLSLQMQNVGLWVRNDLHLDPEVVSNAGVVNSPLPKTYIFSLKAGF